ncbi:MULTISPECIES: hypothetical protein [Hymenobacter]|uniref:hypothetical protein n=1 Tax=Hymenobacter TaxID=89966 RepID=UPI0010590201|nr:MULTISPECIES: hypothetical protein [Hymenobacter]QIL76743.1 hypothetical protein G7064_13405 [Hymenobacter sp. HDW8]
MILAQIDCLRVQYDESLCLLRYQWCGGSSLHSFAQAMNYLAELVQTHQIKRVLVDMNGLPELSMKEQIWVGVSWFPRVAAQSVQHVAVVVPPAATYNQMVVESLLGFSRQITRFDVQFFADPGSALDWLTNSPIHMLALLAEWQSAS